MEKELQKIPTENSLSCLPWADDNDIVTIGIFESRMISYRRFQSHEEKSIAMHIILPFI
jgi:hypothetical protein